MEQPYKDAVIVVHFVEETGVLSGRFSNFPKAEESYSLCSRAHVLNGFILGSIVWLLHSFSGLEGPHFSAPQTMRVSFLWGGERSWFGGKLVSIQGSSAYRLGTVV